MVLAPACGVRWLVPRTSWFVFGLDQGEIGQLRPFSEVADSSQSMALLLCEACPQSQVCEDGDDAARAGVAQALTRADMRRCCELVLDR